VWLAVLGGLRVAFELTYDLIVALGHSSAVFRVQILWLVALVPRALLRLADVARAAVASIRSDEWTVEAVTWLPQETRYTWTTTREHKGQVLAQVEGSLARGDVPLHLRNGVYRGESRSAR
jgi:hypothetical protein